MRTYVAVDGGMSDNLRPMLYGSRYEAIVADRAGDPADTTVTVAGMHCESGDILVRDATLADPRAGDVLVTPATGAYGYAMANNYNGVPRPPVIFCAGGDARLVVRRETYDDLTSATMPIVREPSGGSAADRPPGRAGTGRRGAFAELLAERAVPGRGDHAAGGRSSPGCCGAPRATSTRSSPTPTSSSS